MAGQYQVSNGLGRIPTLRLMTLVETGTRGVIGASSAAGYLDRVARIPADGIVATHEDAALLAVLVAHQRGLLGPKPDVVFACQYKPASRACQEAAAPDAVPRYTILNPVVVFEPPFFVKPVFGTLSGGARRIDDLRQLALLDGNGHARRYATIAEMMGPAPTDACGYLVEGAAERRRGNS